MLRQLPRVRFRGCDDAETGLQDSDADERRRRYGSNNILDAPSSGWRELLRDTVKDPMLWFLIGTGTLFAAVGEYKEAITLAVALIPLAGMDAWLHRRTQVSTAALGGRLSTQVSALRAGAWRVIPAVDLVPGDLVALQAGDPFPADGILVRSDDAQVDESALTGEAFPVRKLACDLSALSGDEPRVDASLWGYAGTRLLAGRARVRVVFTGRETYYGEIVRSAVQGSHARTPLQVAIGDLVRVLLVAAAVLCVVVAWVRWAQGLGILDAFVSAITLAVAALPEEFPVVFTFFLGVGVYRLARRHALVRRAVAVENIGRVTTICADKTGTITRGRLVLTHLHAAEGVGQEELQRVAAWASRAESGDPLDLAILEQAGLPEPPVRVRTFPFTEDRKRETAVVRLADGMLWAVSKGAHETILAATGLDAGERGRWVELAEELASSGHKVIACAQRVLDDADLEQGEPMSSLVFAGLLALEDPVREGVVESVRQCRDAGIHVIMLTGDHPLTARAVGMEIGLGGGTPKVVTADEVAADLERDGLNLREVDVIARSMPSQKLDFVRRLQAAGEIVAVTGDGVNDVPALQAADIGIAMGERGNQAAREVAAVVLTDDNFRTIVRAISEGNQLFSNLRMSFAYLLMIHIPLVVSATLIPLAGYPLLYLPVHIVWLELIIHPTALLAFQQFPEREMVHRHRLRVAARFFRRGEWIWIGVVGAVFTAVLIGGYGYSIGANSHIEHGRAMALALLGLESAAITLILSGAASTAARYLAGITILATVLLIQQPWVASALHLAPLHLDDWLLVAAAVVVISSTVAIARLRR